MAGRVWMKGSANAARITEAVTPPVQAKKRGGRAQNRHVERRETCVLSQKHAAPLTRCQGLTKRLSALRSLMG